jgi:alpha-amylase/alpha-mannosidase (GH57 family)
MSLRAICFHSHFYQPLREDPWLGVVEPEPEAAPDRDWNARITRQCYRPFGQARILDHAERLAEVTNLYGATSWNVGPALAAWLATHAPDVLAAMRAADAEGVVRGGHGHAWAQPWGHPILPLSTPRDIATQVQWGLADFTYRFGRPAEGMWLPEMAVDVPTLVGLADAGVALTMLSPHQARRVRPLGAADDAWQPVTAATLDTTCVYRCRLPGERAIDVVFRDAVVSAEVAFGDDLRDGARLAGRLRERLAAARGDALVTVAVDGETYGHHHRFGEMALAFALRALREDPSITILAPAAFRAQAPATWEVDLVPETSWSCPHGIERWRSDCGCRTPGATPWSHGWRAPLRLAIDWLRDELAVLYAARAGEVLRDPWGARDRYVECLLTPARLEGFLATEAGSRPSPANAVQARRALEMARHALAMQTSCGWFFDDLAGREALLVLRHAARAMELAETLGRRLEAGFLERLSGARSELAGGADGAAVWRRWVRPSRPMAVRVAGTTALLAVLGHTVRLPGYDVQFSSEPAHGRLDAEARVIETTTGAATRVEVVADATAEGGPVCAIGDDRLDLREVFGVQREQVLDAVGRSAVARVRAGRRAALQESAALLEPLLAGGGRLSVEVGLLLGYEEADAIAMALAAGTADLDGLIARVTTLRARGVAMPAEWLARRLARAVEDRVAELPAAAPAALRLLDLATAIGAAPDLGAAQVRLLAWWRTAAPADRMTGPVTALLDRLRVAPRA